MGTPGHGALGATLHHGPVGPASPIAGPESACASDEEGGRRMDSLITAAAQALAAGDPFGALNRVALRDDPPALALRGIAMAQLGDRGRARRLLRAAARAFGTRSPVARARCVVAEAEIALVSRELGWPTKALAAARAVLVAHGDVGNAVHARLLEVRRSLLIGRLDDAERLLAGALPPADPASRGSDGGPALPPATVAVAELAAAGIAMRRLRSVAAGAALERARKAAGAARIPALVAEVEQAFRALAAPAARLVSGRRERLLRLDEVERLFASETVVVDGCRHVVRDRTAIVGLATRPVLFAIARSLALGWPDDVGRAELIADAFRTRHGDDSHRSRLRVEAGRLRALLRPIADVRATARGFLLVPRRAASVVVLARPADDAPHAAVLALLADGESWSSSALALALGASQRSVQRHLETLGVAGRVQSVGRGRSRRWMTPPVAGFATTLLLPTRLPLD